MAKERKSIDVPISPDAVFPDELIKLLNDGWCIKCHFLNLHKGVCSVELEREVPDHEQKRT